MTVRIDRHDALDLALYRRVVLEGERIEVDESLYEQVAETREALLRLVADGVAVYGVTTGLGYLTDRPIGEEDQAPLQHSLLTARASGLTGRLPDDVVRGTMLLRLTGFLSGYAAVTPGLCRFLADRLNDGWRPAVPAGPFGASGEISPLAHLFQTFIGEGHVLEGDDTVPAGEALARSRRRAVRAAAEGGLGPSQRIPVRDRSRDPPLRSCPGAAGARRPGRGARDRPRRSVDEAVLEEDR